MAATVRGYEDVIADPSSGADALLEANPAIDPEFARASLQAYLPLLTAGDRPFGTFDRHSIERMSDFMLDAGLIGTPIAPGRYATSEFVGTGDGD